MKRKSVLKVLFILIISIGLIIISNKSYAAIKLSSNSILRAKGTTYTLKVKGTKKNDSLSAKITGPSKRVVWTTSDKNVVTVNDKGKSYYVVNGKVVGASK